MKYMKPRVLTWGMEIKWAGRLGYAAYSMISSLQCYFDKKYNDKHINPDKGLLKVFFDLFRKER